MIKAILFDRDGVIINSEKINLFSVVKALTKLGVVISEKDRKRIIARHPKDYIGVFAKKYHFNEGDFFDIQPEIYYSLFDGVEVFSKTVELIRELKKLKYLLAIVTSSHLQSTKSLLEDLKLSSIFDEIITFEDCKQRKPFPESYLKASQRLNVEPKNCLVVEDSVVGLKAAKNAGMKCVVIPNEYTNDQDFSLADFIVDDASNILDIITNENKV
jgi:HAD superfamily hydrolase (TIGR01509 family)